MATNYIQEGRYQDWTVASISSGDPVINGTMTGVSITDSDDSNKIVVDTEGVYDLSVKGINDAGNSAVAVGDQIFYVAGDTPVLSKKASGVFFGYALESVLTSATDTINVMQIQGPGPGTGDIPAGSISTAKIADDAVTTAKILDANVTSAKLAAGAGVAALLTAGLGGSVSVTKTSAATDTVVAAHATKDRACLVLVVVDETYDIGTGTLPTVAIGEDDTIEKCMADTVLDDEVAGTVLAFAFTNTATKKIIVTTTAAVGDATGGCSVTVLAIPTT